MVKINAIITYVSIVCLGLMVTNRVVLAQAHQSARQAELDEALNDAVFDEQIDEVDALLARGANPNAIDESGETPLMSAALSGNFQLINILLEAGARLTQEQKKILRWLLLRRAVSGQAHMRRRTDAIQRLTGSLEDSQ